MKAYKLRATTHKRMCHFEGPNHNPIIPAGMEATQVTEGEARGIYHGAACYAAAVKKYTALKTELGFEDGTE